MREIPGLGDRAADRLIALFEQRVEIVDERLHFARVASLEPPIAAFTDATRRSRKSVNGDRPCRTTESPPSRQIVAKTIERRVVDEADHVRIAVHDRDADHGRDRQQADDPQHRAEDQAAAERRGRRQLAASMR